MLDIIGLNTRVCEMAVHVAKFLAGLRSMENGRKYGFHADKDKYDPILWLSSNFLVKPL